MNSIQLELNPTQKGQYVFIFFEEIHSGDEIATAKPAIVAKDSIITENDDLNASQNLLFQKSKSIAHGTCHEKSWAMNLGIGASLQKNGIRYFKVVSKHFMPFSALPVYVLQCVCDVSESLGKNGEANKTNALTKTNAANKTSEINTIHDVQNYTFEYIKDCYNLAIITLSDKGFIGQRIDESAPAISKLVTSKISFGEKRYFILPDDGTALKGLIASLVYTQGFDCIITTGGTGLSERDITPNALLPMLEQRLYGFEHAMMQKSLEKTPTAMLSRAFCGIINKSIIICVPGSVKASTENIEAILPALPHALAKLNGDMSDCARK